MDDIKIYRFVLCRGNDFGITKTCVVSSDSFERATHKVKTKIGDLWKIFTVEEFKN